jgi:hypothetical protein
LAVRGSGVRIGSGVLEDGSLALMLVPGRLRVLEEVEKHAKVCASPLDRSSLQLLS